MNQVKSITCAKVWGKSFPLNLNVFRDGRPNPSARKGWQAPPRSRCLSLGQSAIRGRTGRPFVAHLVRDEGVAGSNPATPTKA
jgi:hypothetical protein